MYTSPPEAQCSIGNTRMLNKVTKVSCHISTVHSCNQNNKFLVTTHNLFLECMYLGCWHTQHVLHTLCRPVHGWSMDNPPRNLCIVLYIHVN